MPSLKIRVITFILCLFLTHLSLASSLAGRVWLDANQNGIEDPNETGVGDIILTLFDINKIKLNQVVTLDTGEYEFINLPFSDYIICLRDGVSEVIDPITLYRIGEFDDVDNDAQPETGCTVFFRTNNDAVDIKNIDFGLTAIINVNQGLTPDLLVTRPSPVPGRTVVPKPALKPVVNPVQPTEQPQPKPVPKPVVKPVQPTVQSISRPSPVPTRTPRPKPAPVPVVKPTQPIEQPKPAPVPVGEPVQPTNNPRTRPSPVPRRTTLPVDKKPVEIPVVENQPPGISSPSVSRIISGLAPGKWAAVPGSQLDFLRACPSATDVDLQHAYLSAPNYEWNFYCAGVINAENGAAYDAKNNRMIVWGGGHSDYAGNEVYAFNLGGARPGWEHLNLPSPLPTNCDMQGGNYCSGISSVEYLLQSSAQPGNLAPASRHTLDTLQYLPDMGAQGSLFAFSGSVWQGGDVSSATWLFDTAQKRWKELSRWDGSLPDANPDVTARPTNILPGLDVFSVYDPVTGNIFAHGNRRLKQFNPKTNQWTLMTDNNNSSSTGVHSSAAYDYKNNRLVVIGGSSDYTINPSYYQIISRGLSQQAIYHDLVTTGDNDIQFTDAPGIAYEPDADVFVAWNGGQSIYVLDMNVNPPNWDKVVLQGDNPGPAAKAGTFGRLRYVPDKKIMMLVNRIAVEADGFSLIKNPQQANVFFFKLPGRFYNNGVAPQTVVGTGEVIPETVKPQTTKHLYPVGNIADAIHELIAGDTLIIHEGNYRMDKRVQISAQGTAQAPIIIMGAEGEQKPVISTQPNIVENTFNIVGDAAYITIKGLEITNGNHEDAVKLSGGGHISHVTLEDLHLHDVSIGVRIATDADHITIRHNHIHDTGQQTVDEFGSVVGFSTGEGMYLGCHDGDCILSDSIIENNLIHDTSPQAEQGDGIELKTRSHDNIVRNNVVYNMGSKQFDGFGGILVWGWSDAADTGSWGNNIVEGNVVWGDQTYADVGIEAISRADVKNNIVFNVDTGLASNPQFNGGLYLNIPVKDVNIANNTVFNARIGVRLIWDQTDNAVFANNIVHASGITAESFSVSCRLFLQGTFIQNVTQGQFSCIKPIRGFVDNSNLPGLFLDPNNKNFWLKPSAFTLIGKGGAEYAPAKDFNGNVRGAAVDLGAYQTNGGASNPGWLIQPGQFKTQ